MPSSVAFDRLRAIVPCLALSLSGEREGERERKREKEREGGREGGREREREKERETLPCRGWHCLLGSGAEICSTVGVCGGHWPEAFCFRASEFLG